MSGEEIRTEKLEVYQAYRERVAEYDAMRLKQLAESPFAQEPRRSIPILALEEMSVMKAERNNVLEIATEQAHKINTNAIELREARLARDAAIARAETAEAELSIVGSKLRGLQGAHDILCSGYRGEIRELKAYIAERDASAKRWVRLGCVLTLLLPLTAHAADAPPTPPQQVVSATIPPPVEPPLQPVTLSPDDYRQLINSRINELIHQDPVAQLLIAHQNAAQAKAKPGG